MASASVPETRLSITAHQNVDELRALLAWLRLEDELRGRVRIEAAFDPDGREMGGALDVLTVALGSGGAGVVLARSLSTWFTHRRSDVKLTIKVRTTVALSSTHGGCGMCRPWCANRPPDRRGDEQP